MTPDEALELAKAHSVPEPNTGCWLWTRSLSSGGYALVDRRVNRRSVRHLIARKLLGLPTRRKGTTLRKKAPLACHHCDTPCCVNPDHLFRGSPLTNAQDTVRKGRHRTADSWRGRETCSKGHALTPENIGTYSYNYQKIMRHCKTCQKLSRDARRAIKKQSPRD